MLKAPVAFLIFNRPDLTELVFERIAEAKPSKLLVIADGPRFDGEAEKCERARAILNRVDWNCEVLTNFSDVNLGCRQRVASGLDWVFSQVEEAIILEDDCLPSISFFSFCETLLERYRYDTRIMMISGDNFQDGISRTEYSYYFSKYVHVWGWASWRRAWKHYDVNMKTWPSLKASTSLVDALFQNHYEKQYWVNVFDAVSQGQINTWDYQWAYACWLQNGLSILPNVNLISNLGFRSDGTNTTSTSSYANLPTEDLWDLQHPHFIIRHVEADLYTFDHVVGGLNMRKADGFLNKLRQIFRRLKTPLNY